MELEIENLDFLQYFFGVNDKNIRKINKKFDVTIKVQENKLSINGNQEEVISNFIASLYSVYKCNIFLKDNEIDAGIDKLIEDNRFSFGYLLDRESHIYISGKKFKPKNENQQLYIQMMKKSDITFGIGPAGTGKTFLAVAMAVNMLLNKEISRIIITRPAVEAGESLGFLPGDLKEKVDPYLRPLYDALFDMLGEEKTNQHLEKNIIEIAPLAYMRGRTLNNSFIILDEAQNTTSMQMKMFLTRLGFNSKVVVTGDITQVDLKGQGSGLIQVIKILRNIDGISIMEFERKDVVRNIIVKEIIKAYESLGDVL